VEVRNKVTIRCDEKPGTVAKKHHLLCVGRRQRDEEQ
jgi:hypothetical protein